MAGNLWGQEGESAEMLTDMTMISTPLSDAIMIITVQLALTAESASTATETPYYCSSKSA